MQCKSHEARRLHTPRQLTALGQSLQPQTFVQQQADACLTKRSVLDVLDRS